MWDERRIPLTDGRRMAVRLAGAGAPVVLLHGIPGSGRTWDQVASRLAEAHLVVVPDLLGFGASSRPAGVDELHAAAQADALAGVLDELGVAAPLVVGHDFGGPVAVTFVHRFPGRASGLVLLAANTFTDTPVPFPLSLVTAPGVGAAAGRLLFSRPSLGMMVRRGRGRGSPPPVLGHYLGDRGQTASVRTIFQASLRHLHELYRPVQDALATVAVPTLVGWGDRDPFFSLEQGRRTAAAVPGAELRVYRGAGHFLPDEQPAEVAADVARLAAGLPAGRTRGPSS